MNMIMVPHTTSTGDMGAAEIASCLTKIKGNMHARADHMTFDLIAG